MIDLDHVYALIMAGGKGTRFWPLSRETRPKHLLSIAGGQPLLRETINRILPLVPTERIIVVTSAAHAQEVSRLLTDIPPENIIIEPVGRNTAPCIGLGAHIVQRRDPEGVMIVLPADHVITPTDRFLELIQAGIAAAIRGETLITFGIKPDRPETGYGYIEAERSDEEIDVFHLRPVRRFHEKPALAQAEAYLAAGHYFWNSGIFIWRAKVILGWLARLLPEMAKNLDLLALSLDSPGFTQVLTEIYPRLPSISIDYGIMEKASGLVLLPADISWSDVGSWTSAAAFWPQINGHAVIGQVLSLDSDGCVVYSHDKLVALVGIKDLVIIETDDSLLICRKDKEQEVRQVVAHLEKQGRWDLVK